MKREPGTLFLLELESTTELRVLRLLLRASSSVRKDPFTIWAALPPELARS